MRIFYTPVSAFSFCLLGRPSKSLSIRPSLMTTKYLKDITSCGQFKKKLTHHYRNYKKVNIRKASELLKGAFRNPGVNGIFGCGDSIVPTPNLVQSSIITLVCPNIHRTPLCFHRFMNVEATKAGIRAEHLGRVLLASLPTLSTGAF